MLNHSALEYSAKPTYEKTSPTLNGQIVKTRTNSESKVRFSESSFNFL